MFVSLPVSFCLSFCLSLPLSLSVFTHLAYTAISQSTLNVTQFYSTLLNSTQSTLNVTLLNSTLLNRGYWDRLPNFILQVEKQFFFFSNYVFRLKIIAIHLREIHE
jgi:hypothetical protein